MSFRNFRIIWDNSAFDGATLTPSSEVATLPASNLQDPFPSITWRTTGVDEESLMIDFGKNVLTQMFSIINHNLSVNATISLTASKQSNLSDPEYTIEDEDVWRPMFGWGEGGWGQHGWGGYLTEDERKSMFVYPIYLKWTGTVVARYWKVTIKDPGNPDGYQEFGRLFLAPYFEPIRNFSWDWEIKVSDESRVDESEGGQDWIDERKWRHLISLPLNQIDNRNKYADYINLSKIAGVKKNILLVLFPESDDVSEIYTTFYGRFTDTPSIRGRRMYSISKLQFKEVL